MGVGGGGGAWCSTLAPSAREAANNTAAVANTINHQV
jgi:hypothetical protein